MKGVSKVQAIEKWVLLLGNVMNKQTKCSLNLGRALTLFCLGMHTLKSHKHKHFYEHSKINITTLLNRFNISKSKHKVFNLF